MNDSKPAVDPSVIVLKNVRLSYPFIFNPRKQKGDDGNDKESFCANFILEKNSAQHKHVLAVIKKIVASYDKWKNKTIKVKGTNEVLTQGTDGTVVLGSICLHDGAEKEGTDGYSEDVMYVSSSRAVTDKQGNPRPKPIVLNRKKEPVKADQPQAPYGGCYVNASIRVWCMDNTFGKRVCAELRSVMFERDGESFGNAPIDASKEFAGLGEEGEFDDEPAPAKKKAVATNVDDI